MQLLYTLHLVAVNCMLPHMHAAVYLPACLSACLPACVSNRLWVNLPRPTHMLLAELMTTLISHVLMPSLSAVQANLLCPLGGDASQASPA